MGCGASSAMEVMEEVPNKAELRLESSTTTRANEGKAELLRVRVSVSCGGGDELLSARRNGERVRVGRRRKVDEPGREARCRPVSWVRAAWTERV